MQIKALACELPSLSGLPLSRFSHAEIAQEAVRRGIAASISGATVWRWLTRDAIRPWHYRSWIFPRDPDFEAKAGRVLDLYHGRWAGRPLGSREYVLCADEKTSIQARIRRHPTTPPAPRHSMRVEHEYERGGAFAYLAALDVHRAKLFGRCEPHADIKAFDRLLADIMSTPPYRSARRVFLVVDNGSSHRGPTSVARIQSQWPRVKLVHLPIHASWLNQIEIYFSIVQRKVLTPNDSESLDELRERILKFQIRYEELAKPFEWRFSREDLSALLHKLLVHDLLKSA
ncbi:MAG: IS630 family transposase [Bacteroidota bacterium]